MEGTAEGEKLTTKLCWFMIDIGEYEIAQEMLMTLLTQMVNKYGPDAIELADCLHASMQMLMNKGDLYFFFFF